MEKSILSLLQDEMCALANAERELRAADICEKQARAHRDAAHVQQQLAEQARRDARAVLVIVGTSIPL